ncbi:MAG: hypothetical protein OQJ96_01375 [Flavobacteriales bacterium]|nr:hypothetical protein [Flavobacteriales bacterium]MCW8938178.1 hypothetical protein [Flavobacteriales bacterium]MCW8967030.1 hypothetical protein [Flavobacteriales bacterium]MCW8991524.1 hypothetical protein [Flavobacteriales bacterium]MCW9018919.1 hypothetical protein [Flavobacteriales bacterium]
MYKELLASDNVIYSEFTTYFIEEGIYWFLLHQLCVLVLAMTLGWILPRLIRILKFDIRYKILRFKNQWYYVFSGEIRSFEKFINANNILGEIDGEENKYKYYPPYVDILVESNSDVPDLYSGYVVDYDLDYENIHELDKVYLLGAHRYRDKRDGDELKGIEIKGNRAKIPIKGDIFILKANRILNLNITFIPSPEIVVPRKKSLMAKIYSVGLGLNLTIFIYFIFVKLPYIEAVFPFLTKYVEDFNFFSRCYVALLVTQFVSLFIPSKIVNTALKKEIAEAEAKEIVDDMLKEIDGFSDNEEKGEISKESNIITERKNIITFKYVLKDIRNKFLAFLFGAIIFYLLFYEIKI